MYVYIVFYMPCQWYEVGTWQCMRSVFQAKRQYELNNNDFLGKRHDLIVSSYLQK